MSYEKQNWSNGDLITAEKLNHMEEGIETALPEACQHNADHTVKLSWLDNLAPMITTYLETKWGWRGEDDESEVYFDYLFSLWDTENNRPKYPTGVNVIQDFLEIEGEGSQSRYIPFTAVVIPKSRGDYELFFDLVFNIYGYKITVVDCEAFTEVETTARVISVGEVPPIPDYNVITQIIDEEEIIEDNESENIQGEI